MNKFAIGFSTVMVTIASVGRCESPPALSKSPDAKQGGAAVEPDSGPYGQPDGRLSVRERVRQAIDLSRDLAARAEEASPEELRKWGTEPMPVIAEDRKNLSPNRFPRKSDVARYMQARPWATHYARSLSRRSTWRHLHEWPTRPDAPVLRELLSDQDPAVRSAAVEALATLHHPQDVPRIARLLGDESEGLPVLGWNRLINRIATLGTTDKESDRDLDRSWDRRKVRTYARLALKLMTGRQFDAETFEPWWRRNSNARHCLWYWQQRLQREMDEATAAWSSTLDRKPYAQWAQRLEELRRRRSAVRRAATEELRELPAEVEAKVRLLARNIHAGGADITEPQDVFWERLDSLRLSPERLLDLMDRKNLWKDVDWQGAEARENYNRMVERLALAADSLFDRRHIGRLRAVRAREKGNLWWSGRAAITIGISRLLPPAEPDNLDHPDTRDGVLRTALRDEELLFTRGYVAKELVRLGLPQNWEFLKKTFFAEQKQSGSRDVRMSIVIALGASPLTPSKRAALRELLLDDRFTRLWMMSNRQGMGRDMYRVYAICSVNAHAGKEVLTRQHQQNLNNPELAAKVLPEVLQIVAGALKEEDASSTPPAVDGSLIPPQSSGRRRIVEIQ